MVLALFALSLAMIVGGIAAVVQGFPYVRLESGLAMVISGTTAASAGVVLLGLGAAVTQLKRLESLLSARRADGVARMHDPLEDAPFDVALHGSATETVAPSGARTRPSLAGTAGLAGLTLGAVAGKDDLSTARASGREPILPNLLPPEEPASARPDEDLFAPPEDRTGHVAKPTADSALGATETAEAFRDEAQEELALRPALDEAARVESEPVRAMPSAGAEPPKHERQAVGSYASGGNTYVMYSDGTIDAETPRGRFTFQSLDELKDFVATGEAGERGAA